jgi:hypothetical protein
MKTDAQVCHAGISPLDTKNPAEHDAGMIPIVEFPAVPSRSARRHASCNMVIRGSPLHVDAWGLSNAVARALVA